MMSHLLAKIRSTAHRVHNSAKKKVRDVSGDSIAESLVAVLIAAMGAALLATMVTSSVSITMKNEARLTALHQAENGLASASGGQQLTISIGGGGLTDSISIAGTIYSTPDYVRYSAGAPTRMSQ